VAGGGGQIGTPASLSRHFIQPCDDALLQFRAFDFPRARFALAFAFDGAGLKPTPEPVELRGGEPHAGEVAAFETIASEPLHGRLQLAVGWLPVSTFAQIFTPSLCWGAFRGAIAVAVPPP
jgi:hypothetical protein